MKVEEIVEVKEIGSTDVQNFENLVNIFIRKPEYRIINIDYKPTPYQERIYYTALITYAYTEPV